MRRRAAHRARDGGSGRDAKGMTQLYQQRRRHTKDDTRKKKNRAAWPHTRPTTHPRRMPASRVCAVAATPRTKGRHTDAGHSAGTPTASHTATAAATGARAWGRVTPHPTLDRQRLHRQQRHDRHHNAPPSPPLPSPATKGPTYTRWRASAHNARPFPPSRPPQRAGTPPQRRTSPTAPPAHRHRPTAAQHRVSACAAPGAGASPARSG